MKTVAVSPTSSEKCAQRIFATGLEGLGLSSCVSPNFKENLIMKQSTRNAVGGKKNHMLSRLEAQIL